VYVFRQICRFSHAVVLFHIHLTALLIFSRYAIRQVRNGSDATDDVRKKENNIVAKCNVNYIRAGYSYDLKLACTRYLTQ